MNVSIVYREPETVWELLTFLMYAARLDASHAGSAGQKKVGAGSLANVYCGRHVQSFRHQSTIESRVILQKASQLSTTLIQQSPDSSAFEGRLVIDIDLAGSRST